MQNLKKYIKIIIIVAFIIIISKIDFGIINGYFKSDIEFYQTNLNYYNKYIASIFVFLSFLFLYFKNRNKPKSKDLNLISPEYLKFSPIIIFIALVIYSDFDKTATNCSLIINKLKQLSSATREFKIDSYDEKNKQLRLAVEKELESGVFTEELEFYKMEEVVYKNLVDKENIKLKFKIGLLKIPFEPEYEK
ncbi:hypothetical protein [Flavobacterium agrisoli]|uniref:Uncharacterized protein n=1 Tax=Flavobacterium agrisoli TaxID=2793066 RepID=A0A934UJA6_9FLAO|nr:hypothetical protein [Flavobacterium agrisoli]MBK0369210.1 hypothetical protein [Flavobacterium agrisoli]